MTAVGGITSGARVAILLKALWNRNIAFFFIGFAMAAYLQLPIMGIAISTTSVAVYLCFNNSISPKIKNGNGTTASVDDKVFFND
ncbi:MAG: PTS sugar transporter subunit IIC [Enterobacteriaceae bacterium]